MPIDTSSYYPEVPDPDGKTPEDSLNNVHKSLFGDPEVKEEIIIVEEVEESPKDSKEPSNKEETENQPIWEKSADLFSNILSWLLVPLIIPVIGIIFIFRLSVLDVIPAGMQLAVIFVILGINFVAPMLLIFLLKMLDVVKDVGLNSQKERLFPYIITALCYGASAWFVASRGAPVWVIMFFCGGAAACLVNLLVNLKWKISAHCAAIAGLVALLIRLQRDVAVEPYLFVWLLITVGVAGLLGTARVWLGRHTVWQVLAGYLVGFCCVFFMMCIH